MKQGDETDAKAKSTNRRNFADRLSRRWCSLDGKALCDRARRQTGLDDFGETPIDPALSILTNSLENEADLHPLGRFLMRTHMMDILKTRLRLAAVWRKQPPHSPIEKPVFITGMPRSGSTFLHDLLAQDPDNRAPKVWEVMFPAGAPECDAAGRKSRVRRANANLWWFRRLAPGADEVYPMRALTPHECVTIHTYSLMSEEFITTCRVPSYEKFIRATGLQSAYAWEKRFLQHLQSRGPRPRWVLKSPDHLHSLEELFGAFPDAMVIQTHRNPIDALKSSLQLNEVVQGLFVRMDRAALQERESRTFAEMMERSIRFRDVHPELADRFMDLNYTDLVSNPLAAVVWIYHHLDCPLTETALERMRHFITGRSRYPRRHNPSLADLGLDPAREMNRFQNYCVRFGIPLRPA